MLWAISCFDGPNAAALREQHVAAHRAHLMASKDILLFAAPMQTDDGASATGTLFILRADSRSAAQQFADADPFARNGVFQNTTVTSLRKGLWNPEVLSA